MEGKVAPNRRNAKSKSQNREAGVCQGNGSNPSILMIGRGVPIRKDEEEQLER